MVGDRDPPPLKLVEVKVTIMYVRVVGKEIGLGGIISKYKVIESPRLLSSWVGPLSSNYRTDHKQQDL